MLHDVKMPLSGKTIMVVDDDTDVLAVTKMLLEHFHAKVEGFTKPDDALEQFKNAPNTYDLVITDIKMPSMNGFELGSRIHSVRADEPILYSSAFDLDTEMAGQTSFDDILEKPFDVRRTFAKISRKLSLK